MVIITLAEAEQGVAEGRYRRIAFRTYREISSTGNQPTLAALGLSSNAFQVGVAREVDILQATATSIIALSVGYAGFQVDSNARKLLWDGTGAAGTPSITLSETLAAATNSPLETQISLQIASAAPTLGALSLSSNTFQVGAASEVDILNSSAGSAISLQVGSAGFQVDNARRKLMWDGTGAAGTPSITLRETLAGATNSPRDSQVSLQVTTGTAPIVNLTAPSFVQPDGAGGFEPATPDVSNQDVMLDVGTWSGGTPPYHYEMAIYDAADNSVILPRTNAGEVFLTGLVDKTIYGRAWCIDSVGAEASADTAHFGPITDSQVEGIGFALRNTVPDAAGEFLSGKKVYVIPADAAGTTRATADGQHTATFGWVGAAPGGSDHATNSPPGNAGPEIAGRWSFTASTQGLRIDLHDWEAGAQYEFRVGLTLNSGAAAANLVVRDGPLTTGTALLSLDAANPEDFVVNALNQSQSAAQWASELANDGGWSAPQAVTNNYVTLQRRATGTLYMSYFEYRKAN